MALGAACCSPTPAHLACNGVVDLRETFCEQLQVGLDFAFLLLVLLQSLHYLFALLPQVVNACRSKCMNMG